MAHNRKLVLSAVSLVKARVRHDTVVMPQLRDELERVLTDAGWFPGAPFRWIGLVVRYGLKMEEEPHFRRIDKKDGELPLAMSVVMLCLLSVARRYQLPSEALVKALQGATP